MTATDRTKLLAQAQKLRQARLDDFSQDAREKYDGKQAELYKYSGTDAALRRKLIDAGFAEVIQIGARSRPGIIRIYPNGTAPAYVPNRRGSRSEAPAAPKGRRTVATALSPRDVLKFTEYLRTQKEGWRVKARRAVEEEFSDVAPSVNRMGFDRVRDYINRVASVSGSEGWRMHLRDQFGEDMVEFFAVEIESNGIDEGP